MLSLLVLEKCDYEAIGHNKQEALFQLRYLQ